MFEFPQISIVIPCFNESRFIRPLVENLLSQDYPQNKIEIIFADGMSTDNTKQLIAEFAQKHFFIHCIDNNERFVSSGLNRAIKRSVGQVIIRMDAHSIYPMDYWSVLVRKLFEHGAENVGGVWVTEAGGNTIEAEAIVIATSHPLGIGNADYRLGTNKDIEVDTVPFGCFRRKLFDEIGYFDTDLIRNQDDEFNGRIRKRGGKIVLISSVKIRYFARENLKKMSTMFFQYGMYKPLVNIKLGKPATLRQFAPPILVSSFMILILLSLFHRYFTILFWIEIFVYGISITLTSFVLTKGKSLLLFGYTTLAFAAIHFSYGLGYIFGMIKFTLLRQQNRADGDALKSSR